MKRPLRQSSGFTLIELMIAVAVLALLTSVALGSYRGQIRKSRRVAAEAFAVDVVAKEQQFLLDRRAYATSVTATPANNGLGMTVPADVSNFYTLTLTADNTTFPLAFTLTLAPQGDQVQDSCGNLTINNALVKLSSSGSNCW